MPIYNFNCPIHGEFERLFPLSMWEEIKNGVMCEALVKEKGIEYDLHCGKVAEKLWSAPAINIVTPPTDYFKNPRTGEVRTANHSNQRAPVGFVKEEARNLNERLKLEKRLNFDQSIENEIKSDRLNEAQERSRKARHEELRSQMGDMDNDSRLLVKAAMERTNKKKIKRKKSEVRIAVNGLNSSNMDK